MAQADSTHILQEQVRRAARVQLPLVVAGNNSKAFYGFPVEGEPLATDIHRGILRYEPTELVLSARAGTPLADIEKTLSERGQMLGCEPPHFGNATFGGMIAAGLSGPRRPFAGSISDQLLGCRILNGRGDILSFGGRVMKNVAGYDVSRLMAGSLGCLGIILEATIKVMPKPKSERSFRFNIDREKTPRFVNNLTGMGYPVSASCHDGVHLVVRFTAGEKEIEGLDRTLGQHFGFIEFEEEALANFWAELREHRTRFFRQGGSLWRVSLPPAAPPLDLPGETLVEWNGALRWLRTDSEPRNMFETAAGAGGSATLFRTDVPGQTDSLFQPLSPALMHWHRRLKEAFDPAGILNPGRMYREL